MKKLFDFSHTLNNDTPVYPGTEKPEILSSATIQSNGFREKSLKIHSHFGTHADAPAHMIENGKFLDDFDISHFSGNCVVIEIPETTQSIEIKHLKPYLSTYRPIEYVLLKTGWGSKWGNGHYFSDFPVLSSEAVALLLQLKLKGIGVDCISVDEITSADYRNHHAILGNETIIIENLNIPRHVHHCYGRFYCFPLCIEKADGSPVRAVFELDL